LEEEYQKTLEEEALLQSIEERPTCPGCGGRIKDNWMVCPSCYTRLKKTCHECGRLMELPWNLCPYCGRATPGMRRENLTMEDALQATPVDDEGVEEVMQVEEVVEEFEAPPEEDSE
jgi:RNA polymerase subunit RPABC4/transcription elongation factor Spt4